MRHSGAMAMSVLALLCALSAGAAASPGAGEQAWNEYEVLMERNIFSRVRGRRLREATQPVEREAPPPEQFVFLRGVVRVGGEFIAVLEDMNSGQVTHAHPGDQVLAGQVAQVTLDGMSYARDGESVQVDIGENLARASAPAASAAAPEGAAARTEAAGGAADMLERLRQRRMRELGR